MGSLRMSVEHLPSMRSEEISSRAKQVAEWVDGEQKEVEIYNRRIWLLSVDTSEEHAGRCLHRWTNPVLVRDPAEGQTSTLYGTDMDKGWDRTAETPAWDSAFQSEKLIFQSLLQGDNKSSVGQPGGA